MENLKLKRIIESALLCHGAPLSIKRLEKIFDETEGVTFVHIHAVLMDLREEYKHRGIELKEVASGFRFQTQEEISPWMQKLANERPPRYSRSLLETLVLIAYRQPITRAEIEEVRGVAVNTSTIKTLLERDWVHIIGYREVPGKPALYGTTKQFLDYFNLSSLDQLAELSEAVE